VAHDALSQGVPVLVLPGGDLDACKSWWHRNDVKPFTAAAASARLAQEAGVPLVPVVITGAGDTVVNLAAGQGLARATVWSGSSGRRRCR
jgi:1-acyl-sn-glycerol-3-phosphate acyltransferase